MENITQVQVEQSLKLVMAKNFDCNHCQKVMGREGRKSPSWTQHNKRKEKCDLHGHTCASSQHLCQRAARLSFTLIYSSETPGESPYLQVSQACNFNMFTVSSRGTTQVHKLKEAQVELVVISGTRSLTQGQIQSSWKRENWTRSSNTKPVLQPTQSFCSHSRGKAEKIHLNIPGYR